MSLVDTSTCARRGGFKLAVHHFIFCVCGRNGEGKENI